MQGSASGTYMGENIKAAKQTSFLLGVNYDIHESVTVKLLFVPYMSYEFEMEELEGSYTKYDFFLDTPIESTETMNNVYIGVNWALPYLKLK